MTDDLPLVKIVKMIRSTKMVNGLLPDGTLIRACEVTFGYLEKQDDRIAKLKAALRNIIDERGICGHCGQLATGEGKRSFVICDKTVLGFKGPCHWTPQDPKEIARKALEGKDDP
jgi:hypothetical protein